MTACIFSIPGLPRPEPVAGGPFCGQNLATLTVYRHQEKSLFRARVFPGYIIDMCINVSCKVTTAGRAGLVNKPQSFFHLGT
jgi:hypothetical protein